MLKVGGQSRARKERFLPRVTEYFQEYKKVLIVTCDNVGSKQLQDIRAQLRGKAVLLMGKNTLIRKACSDLAKNGYDQLARMDRVVKGNCGLVFTNGDLNEVKKIIEDNKVGAPAKAGVVAPNSVLVPAGPTGLEPTQTSFFQALGISTKINRGQIEITQDVDLIKEGTRVGNSEAVLLQKLNIRPFKFGLGLRSVYDNGTYYDAKVLDLTDDDILAKFQESILAMTQLALEIRYPTISSVPHLIGSAFTKLLCLSVEAKIEFEHNKLILEYLENPEAFAAAAVSAAPASGSAPAAAAAAEPEEEEESDEDMGFGLFD